MMGPKQRHPIGSFLNDGYRVVSYWIEVRRGEQFEMMTLYDEQDGSYAHVSEFFWDSWSLHGQGA